MTSPDWSKFKTKKRRKEPPRQPEPLRVLSQAEKAALIANRPDLQRPGPRARGADRDR